MDFDSDYLTKQIIAYIGNKRKLISLIYKAIEESDIEIHDGIRFADLFCGSGVVSRFAKYLGFEVHCNDWEPYAKIIAEGYVKTNPSDIIKIFGSNEKFEELLDKINGLDVSDEKELYISKYYAPHSEDIKKADYRTERLFYTRQNGLSIDKIRNFIEEQYPPEENIAFEGKSDIVRNLLIANLLYESATHTNTSGVFKAFHKEFGGHGKDALKRILSPIRLNSPVLFEGKAPVFVYNEDANKLVRKLPIMDVVYLDPPYNQHQYGSNYHMLNTIARWDKIPEPLNLNEKGVLENKAGIRQDWVNTRSPYCYKDSAIEAFEDLIKNINSRLILISYSSDGIIPFEEMKRICLEKGFVSIVTSGYTTYRGGKQSNSRVNADIEFILAIDTSRKAEVVCEEKIDRIVLEKKVLMMLKRKYSALRLNELFETQDENSMVLKIGKRELVFPCTDRYILGVPEGLEDLSKLELETVLKALESSVFETKAEELEQLLEMCKKGCASEKKYTRLIPSTLKKFAQKKYRDLYYQMLEKVEGFKNQRAELYQIIEDKVKEVKEIAEIRFNT